VDLANIGLDHPDDVLDRVLEGAGLPLLLGEVAEGAGQNAHVRRVDVPVDDEVDPVAGLLALDVIGHPSEPQEVVRLEARQAVLEAQTLARAHLLPDAEKSRVGDPEVVDDVAHRGLHRCVQPSSCREMAGRSLRL
jgi:hypothetical protein